MEVNFAAWKYHLKLRHTPKWMLLLLICVLPRFMIAQEVIAVGGTLEENTVWTNEYSYMVRENLRVPEGVELTIMPGVLVEFYANTGLFIEQGSLKILGNYEGESGQVKLRPRGPHGWLGISFFSVSEVNENIIDNALIEMADVGIDIKSSQHVVVQNSTIQHGTINDIRLHNSSNCMVRNNRLFNNARHSIEIHASGLGFQASDNVISGNFIGHNRLIGIMVRFDNQGVCHDNLILENIIDGAESGIYIDNSSFFFSNDKISIIGNVFSHIGSSEQVGYGISTGMDSTIIKNNIFWLNERAMELRRGNVFIIENNSFYQNYNTLSIEINARNGRIRQNTFVNNLNYVTVFRESLGNYMSYNNIFGNKLSEGIIRNQTAFEINITENYWATDDTLKIKQLLWDGSSEGSFGDFIFEPILLLADTVAPISPPQKFVKQLKNGEVLFSWNSNPESDLGGYALYSGDFVNYRFADDPIIIHDTSFSLQAASIDGNFALTAYDASGHGWQQQRYGHESPFVFATAIPFSGHDTLVCSNESSFVVTQSTVPFPFEQLFWTTDGDGQFDDVFVLRPTYQFGDTDIENGQVRIRLHVLHLNGTSYTDSFLLSFRDEPIVEGPGSIITTPASYILLEDIEAFDFDQIEWSTGGDGFFQDAAAVTPTYFFGPDDLAQGFVQLIVHAVSSCGFDSDMVLIYLKEQYSVEGRVLRQGAPFGGAVVLALAVLTESVMQVAAMAKSNADGSFIFKQLFTAEYVFYAIPDTSSAGLTLPVYYHNKLHWADAFRLPLLANTFNVEIELKDSPVMLPTGQGSLSGKFHLPSSLTGFEFHCQPWFTLAKQNYCNDGLSNVTVLLYNDKLNIPLAFTITDSFGNFYFNMLPFGDYYIEAEKAGFETNLSSLISISPSAPGRNDIALYIEEVTQIKVFVPEIVTMTKDLLYPNPADNYLYITTSSIWDEKTIIEIFNPFGQLLMRETKNFGSGLSSETITINTSNLSRGMYFIRINSAGKVKSYSFIINR